MHAFIRHSLTSYIFVSFHVLSYVFHSNMEIYYLPTEDAEPIFLFGEAPVDDNIFAEYHFHRIVVIAAADAVVIVVGMASTNVMVLWTKKGQSKQHIKS